MKRDDRRTSHGIADGRSIVRKLRRYTATCGWIFVGRKVKTRSWLIAPETVVVRNVGVGTVKKNGSGCRRNAIQLALIPGDATTSWRVDVLERVCCQGEEVWRGEIRDKRKMGRKRSSECCRLFWVTKNVLIICSGRSKEHLKECLDESNGKTKDQRQRRTEEYSRLKGLV